MPEAVSLKQPIDCTTQERDEFARLVREGFAGSDAELPRRIRTAAWLAFRYGANHALTGIAAVKVPTAPRRDHVFERAGVPAQASGYKLELGWVYVVPAHRGQGVAGRLCAQLLDHVPSEPLFATTRPDNDPMIRILATLNFARVGDPFTGRNEELSLYLRS